VHTSRVAVATREMDLLAAKSNALLESLAAARDAEHAATLEAEDARADLAAIEVRLAESRAVVREWVFQVYSGGTGGSDVAFMIEAMATEADDIGDPLGDLAYITEQRIRALQDLRALTAEQVRLSAVTDRAAADATAAARRIKQDSSELAKVVAAQRSRVDELRKLQIAEVEKAGPISSVLVGARTPEARRAAERLRESLRGASVDITDVGKPCTTDAGVYPNGLIPSSGLCPLWSAPGERLAPNAAAAFNALSKAYAAQTGEPLCITDSYRSLAEQISVKATRGRFAATPGTSRHGLGRALDMCGGVQDYSSPAHRWMVQNGPLFGWFHPAWAAAGGSLPEPWHFEFAG
jgi:zinc D-Ala-D-Ala carboxypeptidase